VSGVIVAWLLVGGGWQAGAGDSAVATRGLPDKKRR